jgi:hypothetical protein
VPQLLPVAVYVMAWNTSDFVLAECSSRGTGVSFRPRGPNGKVLNAADNALRILWIVLMAILAVVILTYAIRGIATVLYGVVVFVVMFAVLALRSRVRKPKQETKASRPQGRSCSSLDEGPDGGLEGGTVSSCSTSRPEPPGRSLCSPDGTPRRNGWDEWSWCIGPRPSGACSAVQVMASITAASARRIVPRIRTAPSS